MANPDLGRFRLKLREYRLLANHSQSDLAAYLNLDYSELSNRLNAHKNAHLSHENVRTMVRALADWGAITTRFQAEELLDLLLCPHFDLADWQAWPLSKLTASSPTKTSHSTDLEQNPVTVPASLIVPTNSSQPLPLISLQPAITADLEHIRNLPPNLNPLIGREKEITQVVELLGQPATRLVTLTGAGGSGKTSLALEIGNQLPPGFTGGIYFVSLENVTLRTSLIAEIAGTLKVKETPGQDLLQGVKTFLKDKQVLLILDNFEQLVTVAGLLSELLKDARHLKMLVTSRIPLQLSFEYEFPVGPLALPDKEAQLRLPPDKLTGEFAGMALFVTRSKAVRPDFALSPENVQPVIEICRRLDGLPLALELAAARIRTLSPQKLLERLSLKVLTGGARDLPARQQTLRETIAWSYELLTQWEQRLFSRLVVFVGGCTLEAAEAVCNPGEELDLEIFGGIESLLTKNLLKQWQGLDGETRYGMLVTIREFGLEKLAKSGELEKLEHRFSAYYLTLSRQHEPGMSGANKQAVMRLREVESEYANFRAVLFQALERGKAEESLTLIVTLGDYFVSRGSASEGLSFLEQGLALNYSTASNHSIRVVRARALFLGGLFNINLGNYVKAQYYIEQALVLQRELNDKRGIIFSLNRLSQYKLSQEGDKATTTRYMMESLALSLEVNEEEYLENTRSILAGLAFSQGNYEEARRYIEENLAMCSASGNKWGIAVNMYGLGGLVLYKGKYIEARPYLEQGLALFRELGINWGLIQGLNLLALVALSQGEYGQARAYTKECQVISREFGFKYGTGSTLCTLGSIALFEGDYKEARTYLEESLASIRESRDKYDLAFVLSILGLVAARQGVAVESHRFYEESLALSLKLRYNLYLAQALTGLAGLWLQSWLEQEQQNSSNSLNQLLRIVRLSGAIAAILTSWGVVMFRPLSLHYDENLALAKAKLDKATFEAAFAEGQAMSMDEAAAYALSE